MAKAKKINLELIEEQLVEVAKSRATAESNIVAIQQSTEEAIKGRIDAAIKAGFTVEMLDKKHQIRLSMEKALSEAYLLKQPGFQEALVAWNKDAKEQVSPSAFAVLHNSKCVEEKRLADCFREIPASTRYNFFSQIRSYVAKPKDGLDLWNNKARQAAADNKKKDSQKQGPRNSQVEHKETDAAKKDDAPKQQLKLEKETVVSLQFLMQATEQYFATGKNQAAGVVNEHLEKALSAWKAMSGGSRR